MLARAWDKNGTPPHQTGWKVFLKIFETQPELLLQFGVQAKLVPPPALRAGV